VMCISGSCRLSVHTCSFLLIGNCGRMFARVAVKVSIHSRFMSSGLLCSLVLVARILCWKVGQISSFFFKFEIRQLSSSIGPFRPLCDEEPLYPSSQLPYFTRPLGLPFASLFPLVPSTDGALDFLSSWALYLLRSSPFYVLLNLHHNHH
jgi:hypothetical protein